MVNSKIDFGGGWVFTITSGWGDPQHEIGVLTFQGANGVTMPYLQALKVVQKHTRPVQRVPPPPPPIILTGKRR